MSNKKHGLLMALLAVGWLQGCSWLNFSEDPGRSPLEPSGLRVQARWSSPDLPAEALSLVPGNKTILGQCEFQTEIAAISDSS